MRKKFEIFLYMKFVFWFWGKKHSPCPLKIKWWISYIYLVSSPCKSWYINRRSLKLECKFIIKNEIHLRGLDFFSNVTNVCLRSSNWCLIEGQRWQEVIRTFKISSRSHWLGLSVTIVSKSPLILSCKNKQQSW